MKRFLLITIAVLFALGSKAQVGIGTKNPNQAAKLHVKSRTQGLLVPTTDDVATISDTAALPNGLLIYEESDNMFYYNDSTGTGNSNWQSVNPVETNNTEGTIRPKNPYTMFDGPGTIPLGGIIMWSGDATTIPDGWALCDGHAQNGWTTPDLRGRFIVGYGASNADEGSGAIPSATWDANYTKPGDLSYNQGTLKGFYEAGAKLVTLSESQIAPHTHDVIEYAHTHPVEKMYVAAGTSAAAYVESGTLPTDIPSAKTDIVVKKGGGVYDYTSIINPPKRLDPSKCTIWRYTCTIGSGSFQSTSSFSEPGPFAAGSYTNMYSPNNDLKAYQLIFVPANYVIGFTSTPINSSTPITTCVQNPLWSASGCIDPLHRADLPIGEEYRINETWAANSHENRPPFYVLAFIMRVE